MKIYVDHMPESPRDCVFSCYNVEYGFYCRLNPYHKELDTKAPCLCKDVSFCELLKEADHED